MSNKSNNTGNLRKRHQPRPENSRRNEAGPMLDNGNEYSNPSKWNYTKLVLAAILLLIGIICIIIVYYNIPSSNVSHQDVSSASTNPAKHPDSSMTPKNNNTEKTHDDKNDKVKRKTDSTQALDILENHPYCAGIIQIKDNETAFGCHGTFIDLKPHIKSPVLMTAAHCNNNDEKSTIHQVYYYDPFQNKTIVVNSNEFDIITHSTFVFGNHSNGYDLALIVFKDLKVPHSVHLPKKGQNLPDEFIRYEMIDSGSMYRTKIKEKSVKLVKWEECKRNFPEFKNYEQSYRFCANNGASYTAVGNSGAALLTRHGKHLIIHGIYSAGASKGFKTPDMYMKTESLKETIESFMLLKKNNKA